MVFRVASLHRGLMALYSPAIKQHPCSAAVHGIFDSVRLDGVNALDVAEERYGRVTTHAERESAHAVLLASERPGIEQAARYGIVLDVGEWGSPDVFHEKPLRRGLAHRSLVLWDEIGLDSGLPVSRADDGRERRKRLAWGAADDAGKALRRRMEA